MALFQDPGDDPRMAAAQLADVLAFYGALGDAACGNPAGFATRKAATAATIAEVAQLDDLTRDAVYFAGLLHAVGSLGNRGYRKGERQSERLARIERWDAPAQGARMCESISALPQATADIVRWQSECWDGTGFPDQLRWQGIPLAAQIVAVADGYVRSSDPDAALAEIGMQSGRAFGPQAVRAFTVWFMRNGGEEMPFALPLGELHATCESATALLETIATLVDEHNGVPGRWQRIARLSEGTAQALDLSAEDRLALALAARLYGCGEIAADAIENAQFDPLSRLGIDERANNAGRAAAIADRFSNLASATHVVRSRSEWFDGTGKPQRIRLDARNPAGIIAATIAYDALMEREIRQSPAAQLDGAAGTQFAPAVVRALLETAGARA